MSEYSIVEKPVLDQLGARGWTGIDQVKENGLGIPTDPTKSLRARSREVTSRNVFSQAVHAINTTDNLAWLTDNLAGLVLRNEVQDEAPVEAPVEAHDEAHDLSESERRILQMLRNAPRSVPEIVAEFGHAALSGGLKQAIKRLTEIGFVALTLPDSPRSKNQKRRLTEKGRRWIEENSDV